MKLIGSAAAKRLAEFPDVPAVSETIPDFVATGWGVLVAPVGTPKEIIDKVSADLYKVAKQPELAAKLGKLGSYTRPMTADEATGLHPQAAEHLESGAGRNRQETAEKVSRQWSGRGRICASPGR